MFEEPLQFITREDTSTTMIIGSLQAVDSDANDNGRVSYSSVNSGPFIIMANGMC